MKQIVRKVRSFLPAILVFFLIGPVISSHLSAEDFEIKIPVALKNLHPDFTHLRVLVKLTNTNDPNNFIASSLLTFKIENGKFEKTVDCKTNAFPGRSPSQANKWEVFIFLIRNNQTSYPDSPSNWEKKNPSYSIDRSEGFREYDFGRL